MSEHQTHLDAPTVREEDGGDATSQSFRGPIASFPCPFGEYELLGEVARGGMGVVFRATQLDLNRTVAVKMILDGCLADASDIQRFHAEAEAAANLDHPGIVSIYEVGEFEGRYFFSMAFVDGESLAALLADGPLPAERAASMMADVAEAMEYAHGQGVIHRDLKPGNILVDERQRPRITDFGVAKRKLTDSGLTVEGELLGTPSYMPPEQARGDTCKIFATADVYSLGAVLYATLTGRPPFQSANQLDTLNQVLNDEVTPPTRLNSQIPIDLETITLKCLEKQPERRYQSAGEVANELRLFLDGKPIRARPPGVIRRVTKWVRDNVLVASMSGLTSLLLVAILFGLGWRCKHEIQRAVMLQAKLDVLDRVRKTSMRRPSAPMAISLERQWRQANASGLALLAERHAPRNLTLSLLLAAEAYDQLSEDEVARHRLVIPTLRRLIQKKSPTSDKTLDASKLSALARELAGRDLSEAERDVLVGLGLGGP